ncbi:uncharacterized protein LOC141592055 [Silene latifolia]|uniref:uncharacterized protein LOC141592055 n=1 Tax=Silene latifolia TaxID=37657 RepID=UPI003D76CBC3
MDLDDDFDKPSQPARPSKFKPKSKKQPAKSEAKVEPLSTEAEAAAAAVVVTVKKEVEVQPEVAVVEKMDVDEVVSTAAYGGGGVELKEEESKIGGGAMKEDVAAEEEEDYVVAEYDVYYTPPSPDSQLYVMQYPLRPSWRPYDLEQRCTEVRMKPTTSEMEVDLTMDMESDNYDRDSPLADKMKKQTLSSSGKSPQAATYAVGLLKGKKLYLNPVEAVVQLRPSMKYFDSVDLKKKNANTAVKGEGKQDQNEEVEPWVCLNYHSPATDLAQTYLRKMVTKESSTLQFSMNPYDYLNSLCPGAVVNKTESNGISRRSLLPLPLEERLKKLILEGPHVQRFNVIKHVAPDVPAEDVLKIVQQHANLVQGVWVSKSHDRCNTGLEKLCRDYILFLFTQNPIIKESELESLGHRKSTAKTVLRNISVERPYCKDWKFVEPTDVLFIKNYPDIAEHQWNTWQAHGKSVQEKLIPKAGLKRPVLSVPSVEGLDRSTHEARSVSTSMSKEAREALSKVLGKLFLTHKVCSFQAIHQGLRDTAVSMSVLPKVGAKNSAVMAAVKNVVDAPIEELQAIINEYAINVHGLYVLKSSSEHPELNPLRNDIIDLFRGKESGAALRKGEIMEASKNKPVTTSEFQKVINEYCVSKGGAWVLKSGDGISSNDWQSIFKAAKLL